MSSLNEEEINVEVIEQTVEETPVLEQVSEVILEAIEEVRKELLVKEEEIEASIEVACENFEKAVGLEKKESSKPWYLSSVLIYSLVKNAVASIPYSSSIFEKTQSALCSATSYINKSTSLNVVLEVEECNNMITKLDGTLAALLVKVDDGFDSLREKLGESISSLIAAITSHKAWAEKFATQKISQVNESVSETSVVVSSGIQSRYDQTMEVIRSALAYAKSTFPALLENISTARDRAANFAAETKTRAETVVKSSVESAKTVAADAKAKVATVVSETKSRAEASYQSGVEQVQTKASALETTVRTAVAAFLDSAQPYVHSAVTNSVPYVDKAVELSQPYVAAAKPYIDPVVAKAAEINHSLVENQTVGAYVTQVEEAAASLLDSAKTYCTPVAHAVEEPTGETSEESAPPAAAETNIRV